MDHPEPVVDAPTTTEPMQGDEEARLGEEAWDIYESYALRNELHNLQDAVHRLKIIVARLPAGHEARSVAVYSLAMHLYDLGVDTLDDLNEALDLATEAYQATPRESIEHINALGIASTMLFQRFRLTERLDHLADACYVTSTSASRTPPDFASRPASLANLIGLCQVLYVHLDHGGYVRTLMGALDDTLRAMDPDKYGEWFDMVDNMQRIATGHLPDAGTRVLDKIIDAMKHAVPRRSVPTTPGRDSLVRDRLFALGAEVQFRIALVSDEESVLLCSLRTGIFALSEHMRRGQPEHIRETAKAILNQLPDLTIHVGEDAGWQDVLSRVETLASDFTS